MAKRVEGSKPKKVEAGKSVFDDVERLKATRVWIWSHYCSQCGDFSKKTSYCTKC